MHGLTEGALKSILDDGVEVEAPVFQVTNYKLVKSGIPKYRLQINDGCTESTYVILASQLNHLIENRNLSEFSIMKLNQYSTSMIRGPDNSERKIITIVDCEILVPGHQIGKNFKKNNTKVEEAVPVTRIPTNQQVARPAPQLNNLVDIMNPIMNSNAPAFTTPIAALSPYHSRWVIKARVTNKSQIRTWSNSRGEGKFFSMDLIDESSEIRCTAFRDQCDKFYDLIEIDKVYYISKCQLKPANKQFNHLRNDYEMSLTYDSQIAICNEETETIPSLQFNFVPISTIETMPTNGIIDILGIVKTCSDLQTFTKRLTGQELTKKDVGVVDENNYLINVTLWAEKAQNFDGSGNPVVAIKGAKIGEFNGGKTLSLLPTSILRVNPDIPTAHKLRSWFSTIGATTESHSLSRTSNDGGINGSLLTFSEVDENKLGHPHMPCVYTTKATVNLIKAENALYKSCPSENCKKKVVDQSNGMYRCEKCAKDYPTFTYRLLVNAYLVDWTGNQWIAAFNDEAEILLNGSGPELGELKEKDFDAYLKKIAETSFKSYIFKIRVKQETFNDETRLKSTVLSVQPVNYKMYLDHLLSKIQKLSVEKQ
ncbi:replication protein A 70 kDa DNA-binding subunit [Nasonia vitripennis]|uniref:Replication protein A subunit n=1 Tax=Nasonia vitripennis TaxID=7425 RepID=A0A7M7G5W5_NASVI|nr:replication protein A 70 kDa DNA-binding subunit [Nasonia vitripennis]